MKYITYIQLAYPLIVQSDYRDVTIIEVSEVDLERVIRILSKNGLIHSNPHRAEFSTRYRIYILGGINKVFSELDHLKIWFKYEQKQISEIDNAKHILSQMGHNTLRMYLLKKGYKRGSSSKLYNPQDKVYSSSSIPLELYKAVVIGVDIIDNSVNLFIDAARKQEFTKSIQDLEEMGILPKGKPMVSWVKILGALTSFYVEESINVKNVKEALGEAGSNALIECSRNVLNYLVVTGRVGESFKQMDIKVDDLFEYALIPRSVKLKEELRRSGYLIRIPQYNTEVLFLPKSVLTPVPSLDNVKKIAPDETKSITNNLHISPKDRFDEVESFVNELAHQSDLKTEGLHIRVINEPRKFSVTEKTGPIFLEANSRTRTPLKWDYMEKIRKHREKIVLYVLAIGGFDEATRGSLEFLEKQGLQVAKYECNDLSILEKPLNSVLDKVNSDKRPFKALLVLGPKEIGESVDEELRRKIEFKVLSNRVFCRYISRLCDTNTLTHKIRTVLRSFVIFVLRELSHRLKPLEAPSIDSRTYKVNTIIGIDATTFGLEKGYYKIACAVTMINLADGSFDIVPYLKYSDRGEDAVLAETLRNLVNNLTMPEDSLVLIYVNRANVQRTLLNHLDLQSIGKIVEKGIVIGATKTHSYSRILKLQGKTIVNPEPWIYVTLQKRSSINYGDVKLYSSRYLMSTVEQPMRLKTPLTIKPVLLTILYEEKYMNTYFLQEENLLNYSASLAALNNVSAAWSQSLPWPLHIVDRKLKRAHELAPQEEKSAMLKLLYDKEIFRLL